MSTLLSSRGVPFLPESIGGGGNLSVATMRTVYHAHAVVAALEKLPHQEHESRRTTYERMLEK